MSRSSKPSDAASPGTLFIVATPIGNLEDITFRAVRILREADLVLAEDTRRSRGLCTHYGIDTPLRSFHAHSDAKRVAGAMERLQRGERIALVTDAGSPLVSDPGSNLVEAALEIGLPVEVIPGPSAVVTALSASGLYRDDFRFVGFLPRQGEKRRRALQSVTDDESATVFFEAPVRLARTLSDLLEVAGPTRRVAVCRELTKLHEEIARGTLGEIAERFKDGTRGEVTVVIEGLRDDTRTQEADDEEKRARLDAAIRHGLANGARPSVLAAELSTSHHMSKRIVYQRILELRG